MENTPSFEELQSRLRDSVAFYGGELPENAALVWDGYFAALLEWGLISVDDHAKLHDMLPDLLNNPVIDLFLGWVKKDYVS